MFVDLLQVIGPLGLVALGALVALASEPFLRDADKHRVLPWLGTAFLAVAALTQLLVMPAGGAQDLHGLLVTDPARAWLSLTVIACALLAMAGLQQSLGRDRYPGGEPYALTLLAAVGAMLMVQANDYLALVVGLELASLSIYASIGLRRHRLESGEGVFKYLVMGAVFSALLLYGVALSYGATGSTRFGAGVLEGRAALFGLGQTFVLIGLLFKIGAVPFHFWSPDAYTGAPLPVTGFMAAVMKVGGFVALGAVWLHQPLALGDGIVDAPVLALSGHVVLAELGSPSIRLELVLLSAAALSLLLGNFSALGQSHLRRLMAFSSVAHAGYMLLAFALVPAGGELDLASLWYYLAAYALATAGVLTAASSWAGSDDMDPIEGLDGAARRHPAMGVFVTILLASLAGLPPTAGFLGKYLVLAELVDKGRLFLAGFAMLMAVVGVVYYLRVILTIWSSELPPLPGSRRAGALSYAAVGLAAVAVLALLLLPELGRSGLEHAPLLVEAAP